MRSSWFLSLCILIVTLSLQQGGATDAQRCPNKSEKWIDLGGDFCYLIEKGESVSWMDAVYHCYTEGASLASFHSSEDVKRIVKHAKNEEGRLHIGLWKHSDGSFEWVDKSTFDFINWDNGEPSHREELCGEMYTETGRWNDIPCSKETGYICSSLKGGPPAPELAKVCPDTSSKWSDFGGDLCFIVADNNETTWDDALRRCSEEGGSLAIFHSIEEVSVLFQQIKSLHERMHIGLQQNRDGQFQWTDKSPLNFAFWNFGEPNDEQYELCGEMYPGSGRWNDIPCDKNVGYICSTRKVVPGTSSLQTTQEPTTTVSCGGDVTSDSGTISSPHYPENYGPNENCLWKITVPGHHQVALNFQTIKVEYGADCEFDYIEILDGHEADSNVIRKICGSPTPQMVLSLGNKVGVKFVSDGLREDTGFVADFTKVEQCGGNIVSEEGVLQTRRHPENYYPGEVCTWKIRAPDGNKILFKFQSFEVEPHRFCAYDYVEILDGHDQTSPSLGKFCGADVPSDIISSGHKITVNFVSDSLREHSGFSAEFKKASATDLLIATASATDLLISTAAPAFTGEPISEESCGEDFIAESGIISSPNYPSDYGAYETCLWKITVPKGYQVVLKFKTFALESDSGCTYDYVKINDGFDYSSPVLGKYCGYTVPPDVISSGNKMSMSFKTDSSGQHTGFAASFTKGHAPNIAEVFNYDQSAHCGESITAEEGIIKSPNYPGNYGPNERCTWKITVPEGFQVSLKFLSFNVETHAECSYDYVEIVDNLPQGNRIRARLCGYDIPEDIRSSGNELMVSLKTDSTSEYGGFSAEFKKVVPVLDANATTGRTVGCGGLIESEHGNFHSPNYPENYPPLAECTWTILVPEGHYVVLTFQSIQVEPKNDCEFDYVKVFDGSESEGAPLLRQFCGTEEPNPIFSSQNKITVIFATDDSFEYTGFSANFSKVEICEKDVVAEGGVIQSPNYPDDYEPHQRCTWHITLPEDSRVLLKFLTFDVDYSPYCKEDSVKIFDGYNATNSPLRTFCGSDLPNSVYSFGNQLTVQFTSNAYQQRQGFSAEFKPDTCGGNFSGDSGYISTPEYPNDYRGNALCTWKITVPEGHKVTLQFEAFSVESCTACSCDSVEVLDGHDMYYSPSVGRFCGQSLPSVIRSSTEKMSVVFRSDSSVQYSGFNAKFTKDVCGGDIVSESGRISSPNFPEYYGRNEDCLWTITVPENHQVVLRFDAFLLHGGDDCTSDYVEVLDGHGLGSPTLGAFCGRTIPAEIRSSTEKMSVRFVSDEEGETGGFSAEFRQDVPAEDQIVAALRELPGLLLKQRKRNPKLRSRPKVFESLKEVKNLLQFLKKK